MLGIKQWASVMFEKGEIIGAKKIRSGSEFGPEIFSYCEKRKIPLDSDTLSTIFISIPTAGIKIGDREFILVDLRNKESALSLRVKEYLNS
jgi:hypothetical protein